MMQQLIFDLYPAASPSLDNFVVGCNDEALAVVRGFIDGVFAETLSFPNPPLEEAVANPPPPLAGEGWGGGEIDAQRQNQPPFPPSRPSPASGGRGNMCGALSQRAFATAFEGVGTTGLFLWGASGSGKTHLLQAAHAQASAAGFPVHMLTKNDSFPPLPELLAPPALWVVDDIDNADDDFQGYLFTLYNALKENGGGLLVSAAVPPARLTLREDLRTRLGWGGIYEIVTLRDEDKLQALITHADARGLRLPAEVVAYLLKHGRRDMRSLVAVLDALDRYSLSLKRPLTLPLVREWLSGGRGQKRINE